MDNDSDVVYYVDTNKNPDDYSRQEILDLALGRAKPKPKSKPSEKTLIDEQVEYLNCVRFDVEDWEGFRQAEDKINNAIGSVKAIRNSSSVDDRREAAQKVVQAQDVQQVEGKWWEEYSCPADKLEYAQSGYWGLEIEGEDYIENSQEQESVEMSFDKETASQQLEDAGMGEKYVGMTADILERKSQGNELSSKQQNALDKAQEVIGDKLNIESVGQVEVGEPSSASNGSFDKETASKQLEDAGMDRKYVGMTADILEQKSQGKDLSSKQQRVLDKAQEVIGNKLDIESVGQSQPKKRFLEKSQEQLRQETKVKKMGAEVSANAEKYMQYAKENGIAHQAGSTATIEGEKYTVSEIDGRMAVFNKETDSEVVSQGGEVIKAEGVNQQDLENWQRVGEMVDQERKRSKEKEQEQEEEIEA